MRSSPVRVGRTEGDLAAALASYRAGLSIRERLAAADPSHSERQRDLAVSYGKLGLAEARRNNRAAARWNFVAGLAIISRLIERSPTNATLPGDQAWFAAQIAALDNPP